jgi:hypothetical protein
MKGLRIICIFALVALFVLGSMGTVFAKGPQDDNHGKGTKGAKQGFAGNVTDVVDGNVTLALNDGVPVNLLAGGQLWYKIPREINIWQQGNITDVIQAVDGKLIGRRAVVQAGNYSGDWVVLKFMVLPIPASQPMHAHHTGNVTVFNEPSGGINGNITITDVHGEPHQFTVGNSSVTVYHPKGTEADDINPGSFVTVVVDPKTKLDNMPLAKAIVFHANIPEGWPTPAP